jgi:hypothetical protein
MVSQVCLNVNLFLASSVFIYPANDYVTKLIHIVPSVWCVAVGTNYLFKVWINMIALKPIVPSHYILLHLLLQIVDVFHMRHGNIISQF